MSTLTKHGRNPRILRQRKKMSSCAILELELLWRKVKQVLLQPLTWSCNNVNVAGYMCVAAIQSRCIRMMYVVCWMYIIDIAGVRDLNWRESCFRCWWGLERPIALAWMFKCSAFRPLMRNFQNLQFNEKIMKKAPCENPFLFYLSSNKSALQ